LLVYRFGPSHYLLVINAGNIDKDYAWIARASKGGGAGHRHRKFQQPLTR
jgi:glycine cleavage system aminomethyltransferase T